MFFILFFVLCIFSWVMVNLCGVCGDGSGPVIGIGRSGVRILGFLDIFFAQINLDVIDSAPRGIKHLPLRISFINF